MSAAALRLGTIHFLLLLSTLLGLSPALAERVAPPPGGTPQTALLPPDPATVCGARPGTGVPDLAGGFWNDPDRPNTHWYLQSSGVQSFGFTWMTYSQGRPIWLVIDPTRTDAQYSYSTTLYKLQRDPLAPGQPQRIPVGSFAAAAIPGVSNRMAIRWQFDPASGLSNSTAPTDACIVREFTALPTTTNNTGFWLLGLESQRRLDLDQRILIQAKNPEVTRGITAIFDVLNQPVWLIDEVGGRNSLLYPSSNRDPSAPCVGCAAPTTSTAGTFFANLTGATGSPNTLPFAVRSSSGNPLIFPTGQQILWEQAEGNTFYRQEQPITLQLAQTSCVIPDNGFTCPITVSWSLPPNVPASARLMRLQTTLSTLPISSARSGSITENLPPPGPGTYSYWIVADGSNVPLMVTPTISVTQNTAPPPSALQDLSPIDCADPTQLGGYTGSLQNGLWQAWRFDQGVNGIGSWKRPYATTSWETETRPATANRPAQIRLTWYTFNAETRPIWLQTEWTNLLPDNYFLAHLREYRYSPETRLRTAGANVGRVEGHILGANLIALSRRVNRAEFGAAVPRLECLRQQDPRDPPNRTAIPVPGTFYAQPFDANVSPDAIRIGAPYSSADMNNSTYHRLHDSSSERRPVWLQSGQTGPVRYVRSPYVLGYPSFKDNSQEPNCFNEDCITTWRNIGTFTSDYYSSDVSRIRYQLSINATGELPSPVLDGSNMRNAPIYWTRPLGAAPDPGDGGWASALADSQASNPANARVVLSRLYCRIYGGICDMAVNWAADPETRVGYRYHLELRNAETGATKKLLPTDLAQPAAAWAPAIGTFSVTFRNREQDFEHAGRYVYVLRVVGPASNEIVAESAQFTVAVPYRAPAVPGVTYPNPKIPPNDRNCYYETEQPKARIEQNTNYPYPVTYNIKVESPFCTGLVHNFPAQDYGALPHVFERHHPWCPEGQTAQIGTYKFSVQGCSNEECGEYSEPVSVSTCGVGTGSYLPRPPRNVYVGRIGSSLNAEVQWQKELGDAGTEYYQVARAQGPGFTPLTIEPNSAPVNAASEYVYKQLVTVPIAQTFRFSVRACKTVDNQPSCTAWIDAVPDINFGATGIVPDHLPVDYLDAELPPHDATVGTLPGEAMVDGGAAAYVIPIAVPPGRAGMEPELSLRYSSRAGNGIAGMGWSLSGGGSSIHRCAQTPAQDNTSRNVQLDQLDKLCLDGERLVLRTGSSYGVATSQYRTEIDSFTRVTQVGGDLTGTNTCFKAELKSGRILHFGGLIQGGSCTVVPAAQARALGASSPMSWSLTRVEDRLGNQMDYTYLDREYAESTLEQINYTGFAGTIGTRTVKFSYEERPYSGGAADWSSSYLAGTLSMQRYRLTRIETGTPEEAKVRSLALNYTQLSPQGVNITHSLRTGRSLLQAIEECAWTQNGTQSVCRNRVTQSATNSRAMEFLWSDLPIQHEFKRLEFPLIPDAFANPNDGGERNIEVIGDLDGDGTREMLITQKQSDSNAHAWLVKMNADRVQQGVFDLSTLPPDDSLDFPGGRAISADIDGDGRQDGQSIRSNGYFNFASSTLGRGAPLTGASSPLFRSIKTNIPMANSDPIVSIQDINADGYVDVLINKPSGASCGAIVAPGTNRLLCAYLNQSKAPLTAANNYCLASTAGDGSCYQFSAGIVLDNWEPGQEQMQLTDVNGDGIADVFVHFGGDTSGTPWLPTHVLVSNAAGNEIPGCTTVASSTLFKKCSLQNLGVHDQSGNGDFEYGSPYSRFSRPMWMDINGDGLDDLLYASPTYCGTQTFGSGNSFEANNPKHGRWCVQINHGRGLKPMVAINDRSGVPAAQGLHLMSGDKGFRYLGKTPVQDVDGDGRPEIFFPARLAARMCTMTQRTNQVCTRGATPGCAVIMCSEDPRVGDPATMYPPVEEFAAIQELQNTYSSEDPLPNSDSSAYAMAAMRFVQTGENSFRAEVIGEDVNGYDNAPTIIANLTGGPRNNIYDDLYGDGLPDVVSTAGCKWVGEGYGCFPLIEFDGTPFGPNVLPDGTKVVELDDTNFQYINENIGSGAVEGSSPILPEMLLKVTDAMGGETNWQYVPLGSSAQRAGTRYPLLYSLGDASYVADEQHYYFTSSMAVVSRMWRSNGLGGGAVPNGGRSSVYGYEGAVYNHRGRGFQGFRKILEQSSAINPDAASRALRVTTTWHQKYPLTGQIESSRTEIPPSTPNRSQATWSVMESNPTGTTVEEAENVWRCDVANRDAACALNVVPTSYPYVHSSVSRSYDLAQAELGSSSASTLVSEKQTLNFDAAASSASGWDAYGNLTVQRTIVRDGSLTDVRLQNHTTTSRKTYSTDEASWWLDRLTNETVSTSVVYCTSVVCGAAQTPPAGVSTTSADVVTVYNWNQLNRTLSSSVVQPEVPEQTSTTTYAYPTPNYGLPSSVTVTGFEVTPSRTSQMQYSPDGYFVRTQTNALNQSSISLTQERDGQVTQTTDPNGSVVKVFYDAFGRETRRTFTDRFGAQIQPAQTRALTRCNSTGSCPGGVGEGNGQTYAVYRQTQVQDGAPTQVEWFDQLGRSIKKAQRSFEGTTFIQQLTSYDAYGAVSQTSQPHLTSGSAVMTTFVYDRAGRTITKNEPAPDGPGDNPDATLRRITQYTYDRHKVSISVSASNGCPTPNACMSMSRTSNALGQMMETVDAMAGKTQYWNNSAGHPVAIRDAALKVTTAVYNALGHRTELHDPNMGTWRFEYNALGELKKQTDARRATLTINQRDALGRVLDQKSEVDLEMGLGHETIQDLYQYDPANAIGAPFKITRKRNELQVWEEQYEYDAAVRPKEIRTNMQGESLWTTAFQYDTYYGREKGRTYASGLIVRTQYTKYGAQSRLSNALTDQQYSRVMDGDAWGNTTREEYGNGVVGEYQFNNRTGQNQNRRWLVGGSVPQDELKYTYDNLGNLASQKRLRSVTDALETYQYDELQRLTQTTRTLNGSGAVSVNYAYDAVGNLKKKTDFSSNSDTAYQYTYPGPNQVSAVALASGGTASYTYDENGNLTGGSLRQAAYDAGNMLKRTQFGSQIAEFEYAPTGQRYRGATSGETSYYGPAGLERTTIGGVSSWRHELGSAIVVRENGVDKTSYVARDRLGSVVAIMEPGVATPQYRSYDAFGQARNGDFSPRAGGTLNLRPTTLRGFTEHEHVDEVQLIHMNGRAYDYQLGRFLSVDPFIQFPENSQSLNPYSYLMNNPMAGTDPSGYCQTLPGSRICDPRAKKEAFLARHSGVSARLSAQFHSGVEARASQLARIGWRSQTNAGGANESPADIGSLSGTGGDVLMQYRGIQSGVPDPENGARPSGLGFEEPSLRVSGGVFFVSERGKVVPQSKKDLILSRPREYYAKYGIDIDLHESANLVDGDVVVGVFEGEGRASVSYRWADRAGIRMIVSMVSLYSNSFDDEVIAHEFGHVLGLKDRYSDRPLTPTTVWTRYYLANPPVPGIVWPPDVYSVPDVGYGSNLMGNSHVRGVLQQHQLETIHDQDTVINGLRYER